MYFLLDPMFWAFVALVTVILLVVYYVQFQATIDANKHNRRDK